MKRFIQISSAVLISLAWAGAADAQARESATTTTGDSLAKQTIKLSASADSALRDLERAATELARTVEETVRRTADDPELRVTAMKLAVGAVTVAQQTLVENVNVLERMLAEASRQLAQAQAAQEARAAAKKQ